MEGVRYSGTISNTCTTTSSTISSTSKNYLLCVCVETEPIQIHSATASPHCNLMLSHINSDLAPEAKQASKALLKLSHG